MSNLTPATLAADQQATDQQAADQQTTDQQTSSPQPLRDKNQVSRQFSRAASSYDSAASIQQQALNQLIRLLQQQHPDGINGHWLDIGCGTGMGLQPLQLLGASSLHGIDLADGMLRIARQKAESLPCPVRFSQADADQLPIQPESTGGGQNGKSRLLANGILSSLMLQWSEDPELTLREWFRAAQPGATLAVATLLPGTHAEIASTWQQIDQYRHVNNFVTEPVLQQALANSGWQLQQWQTGLLQEDYSSVTALLKGLKAIGATNVNSGRRPGLAGRQLVRLFEQYYPKDNNGHCPLSYQLCWFIAYKPESQTT
ncbi:methyltransferase domain-containing protein [Oceanobacter mangrovi]|uniref:methyltransferase domain-containing protein n=1 Tax=Oceanobacter mangrovi TaxID=2862510 RepID=UPI001C8E0D19|nr:methyltransferase domain-containing protein [Oceanobacter mangrovi]